MQCTPSDATTRPLSIIRLFGFSVAKAATSLQEVEQILQDINSTCTNNPRRSYSMYIHFIQELQVHYNPGTSTQCISCLYHSPISQIHDNQLTNEATKQRLEKPFLDPRLTAKTFPI